MKTYGVPYDVFIGTLCPPGGNAWGDVLDEGPHATLLRELVKEEVIGPAAQLFARLVRNAEPWRAMLVPTAKAVADMAVGNVRPGILTRVAYFTIPVLEPDWAQLQALQAAHPNLLTEGRSLLSSSSQVVRTGGRFAYGHDQAMRLFWESRGLDVKGMHIYPNGEVQEVPWLDSYEDIFDQFEVARRPNRFMERTS